MVKPLGTVSHALETVWNPHWDTNRVSPCNYAIKPYNKREVVGPLSLWNCAMKLCIKGDIYFIPKFHILETGTVKLSIETGLTTAGVDDFDIDILDQGEEKCVVCEPVRTYLRLLCYVLRLCSQTIQANRSNFEISSLHFSSSFFNK
jgi:hypothetical protein